MVRRGDGMTGQHSRAYINASRRLMQYVAINRSDSEFAKHGEIVYIFDTSVLEAYWRREPNAIGGRYGIDALLTENASRYSSWIALKFLFEHRLPGMEGAAFLSPAHWNEAFDRLSKLETEIRQGFKTKTAGGEKGEKPGVDEAARLDAKLKSLLAKSSNPLDLIEEAKKEGLDDDFTKIMAAISSSERVKRLFVNGRSGEASVRDLTFCDRYWNPTDYPVRHEDFRRWNAKIAMRRAEMDAERRAAIRPVQQGDGSRHDSPKSDSAKSDNSRNNENDAITLATIQALYRDHKTVGSDVKTLFVFVTPDAALHAAFQDLAPQLAEEGVPYFLRHPQIYTPLLNHMNMSNDATATRYGVQKLRRVFEGVETALDMLFPFAETDQTVAQQIGSLQLPLEDNIASWSRTAETICLANSHYILSDIGGEYVSAENIAKLLSTPDVREAAATSVSGDIALIRDDHIQTMSALALQSLASIKLTEGAPLYRAPVKLLDIDIPAALGIHVDRRQVRHMAPMDALLRSLSADDTAQFQRIYHDMRNAWHDPARRAAAQLLASCIYFAVDAWDSARTCAELCHDGLQSAQQRRSPWKREARYCEALAIRMQLRSGSEVTRGRQLLLKNLATAPQSLAKLRDMVELSALVLTAAIVQTIEDDLQHVSVDTPFINLIDRGELSADFEDALQDIDDVLRDLENFETESDDGTATRVRLQAETNRLGGLIFHHLIGARLSPEPVDRNAMRKALQNLEATLDSSRNARSMTARTYTEVAKFLLSMDREAGARALDLLTASKLRDVELSRADQAEIDFFVRKLSASLGVMAA